MFESIKRWMAGDRPEGPDWSAVSAWASQHGHRFKRAKEEQGFVIEGAFGDRPWRLEWGPPQRAYIDTEELRIRMELKLPSDLQMMVLTRPLLELLERETFEHYTESTQTHIDIATPEEMRWLAMFPKVTLVLPKAVRGRFGAVGSNPQTTAAWVDGTFAQQLEQATQGLLASEPPLVLMTLRGRVYLRLELDPPDPLAIAQAVDLFHAAAQAALNVSGTAQEGQPEWPTTASTAWQSQLDDLSDRRRR